MREQYMPETPYEKKMRSSCAKKKDSEPKTVKVRIPVAVDRYGDVAIPECYNFYSDEEKLRRLHQSSLVNDVQIHWREFEVPIREPVEVKGEVEA